MNYQEQQLLNSLSERVRTLEARLDSLVESMTTFKNKAEALLIEMSQAHKPQEKQ
ncbi:MAG: hypothetical protein ACJ72H_28620 [Candidatus Sulfotelmatobacter sp.]